MDPGARNSADCEWSHRKIDVGWKHSYLMLKMGSKLHSCPTVIVKIISSTNFHLATNATACVRAHNSARSSHKKYVGGHPNLMLKMCIKFYCNLTNKTVGSGLHHKHFDTNQYANQALADPCTPRSKCVCSRYNCRSNKWHNIHTQYKFIHLALP